MHGDVRQKSDNIEAKSCENNFLSRRTNKNRAKTHVAVPMPQKSLVYKQTLFSIRTHMIISYLCGIIIWKFQVGTAISPVNSFKRLMITTGAF